MYHIEEDPDYFQGSLRLVYKILFRFYVQYRVARARSMILQWENLPPNPKTLSNLGTLPVRYQKTLTGEHFLIYDSPDGDDSVNVDRVVVLSIQRNLKLLALSDCCFLDRTFKV
ncbi:hypothetical protein QTP88_006948 [Uroleucon formosanum]